MKKIGFIDYYISEWHANNYPAWIKEASVAFGEGFEVGYAYAELDRSPIDGITTKEWCEKHGVVRCGSIAELCERSDFVIILSPSDPDRHLPYAREALKYGKRTYIDKTFAPCLSDAEAIFAASFEYGAPFFSTSALRYAEELDRVQVNRCFMTTGGGSALGEYIIHQIEMVVKKLGTGATDLTVTEENGQTVCKISYRDEREAIMTYGKKLGFTVSGDADAEAVNVSSPFFMLMIRDILRFFAEGTVSFDTAETLEAMKIRDAVLRGISRIGERISIDKCE